MRIFYIYWHMWCLNSNLMICTRISSKHQNKIGGIEKKMLLADVAKSLPCWLSQFRKAKLRQPTGQRLSNVREQQKFSIGPILFLYYEESLVSSNLDSKQLRFHGAHPTLHTIFQCMHNASFKIRKNKLSESIGRML